MNQTNTTQFGNTLRQLRTQRELSLREICKIVNYDSSNWSKIERGLISPPAQRDILVQWAMTLGLKSQRDIQDFIDEAHIAQGIIPVDLLAENRVGLLPAFFRTIRNQKPTKEDIDKLIALLKDS